MPYFFDEEGIEWPDGDTEPPPPRAEQFIYLPASDFTGRKKPVRLTVPAFDPSFRPPRQSAPKPRRKAPYTPQPAYSRELAEKRWQQQVALMVPALKDLGVKQIYCRYDGGNDEGFAWFDHAVMQSGEMVAADALARRLSETDLPSRVHDAGLIDRKRPFSSHVQMIEIFNDWLANEWAGLLLGRSFGTGQYSMYGAFTVDLDECTIEDDPNADPVVQHISIAEGG